MVTKRVLDDLKLIREQAHGGVARWADYTSLSDALLPQLIQAAQELLDLKAATQLCPQHKPSGGYIARCLVCTVTEQHRALSAIGCILEKTEVCLYDLSGDVNDVVKLASEKVSAP
jgi:hypothetical protein